MFRDKTASYNMCMAVYDLCETLADEDKQNLANVNECFYNNGLSMSLRSHREIYCLLAILFF